MKHEDYAEVRNCYSRGDLIKEYEELYNKKGTWIFRGHKNEVWDLMTTLERLTCIIKPENFLSFEFGLLRKFKREFHLYSQRAPNFYDLIEWFSLMQHHGTPTRLLDCTYSFYVATYFALEDVEYNEENGAVWAINCQWLEDKLTNKYPHFKKAFTQSDRHLQSPKNLKKIINTSGVIRINPYYMHERLSVQQGCFLLSGNITEPFVNNLLASAGSRKELKKHLFKFVIKIKVNKSLRKEILKDLFRMNITRTSLFPGIDGYASSLKVSSYIFPEIFIPGKEYFKFIKLKKG